MTALKNPHQESYSTAILEVQYGKDLKGKYGDSFIASMLICPNETIKINKGVSLLYLNHNLSLSEIQRILNITNEITPEKAKSQEFKSKLQTIVIQN